MGREGRTAAGSRQSSRGVGHELAGPAAMTMATPAGIGVGVVGGRVKWPARPAVADRVLVPADGIPREVLPCDLLSGASPKDASLPRTSAGLLAYNSRREAAQRD